MKSFQSIPESRKSNNHVEQALSFKDGLKLLKQHNIQNIIIGHKELDQRNPLRNRKSQPH